MRCAVSLCALKPHRRVPPCPAHAEQIVGHEGLVVYSNGFDGDGAAPPEQLMAALREHHRSHHRRNKERHTANMLANNGGM